MRTTRRTNSTFYNSKLTYSKPHERLSTDEIEEEEKLDIMDFDMIATPMKLINQRKSTNSKISSNLLSSDISFV